MSSSSVPSTGSSPVSSPTEQQKTLKKEINKYRLFFILSLIAVIAGFAMAGTLLVKGQYLLSSYFNISPSFLIPVGGGAAVILGCLIACSLVPAIICYTEKCEKQDALKNLSTEGGK